MPAQDAIALLKDDHRTVKELFSKFDKAGPRAHKTQRSLVDRILVELAVHAVIEEEVFYPMLRERIPKLEDDTLEALEEHHLVKLACSEIEKLEPQAERFRAKVTVLKENVLHHIAEEERDLFPAVRKAFSRSELQEIGAQLAVAKRAAPTRAHPHAPDEPPGNIAVGLVAKPIDAAIRAGKHAAEGAVEAAGRAARGGRRRSKG